ncbi:MAG: RHS repeat-associated core domain-containing protein [Acidobacteriota bacterium]
MPDGSWSTRQTLYNALHWKTEVTEPGSAKKTQLLDYDPFGRPGTIRPPDGQAHDVTLSYLGARKVTRTARVGNSLTGSAINEVLATTQEFYDRQGRLSEVREQADANGTDTTTTYFYDVGNRLRQVRQATSAGTQNRFFTYDNRGFLTGEQHPEKGADPGGNGVVSYSRYDARGHAGRKIDGPNDLTFTYDRAERLKQVDATGGSPLKVFHYGSSNAAGVRTNGRLESALRYNQVGAPFNATVLITETYTYGARQGRISGRTTQMTFNGTPGESFTQGWAWNALGNLSNVTYPVCQFAACVPAARSIVPGYTNGFLTSVPGWASLSYHPNGMVNQVVHTNEVVDTQANDPDGMRRPSLISSAKGGSPLWSSGAYVYDGSGNIVKTGNGYYLYDRVSRLIEGRVYDGPTGLGNQKWQSYAYDPFGNILSIGGTSGRSTPTNPLTNRLSATGTTYDAAGNLKTWNGNSYDYDGFNQMVRMKSGTEDWVYLYTAGDERFWSYRVGGGGSLWALRDVDGRVLREYEAHVNWSTYRDYIYRGTQLLGSSHPTEGDRHFHLDHLGTPRLITNPGGFQVAYHVYYPFGEEATAFNQDAEQMKLTGHERDLASPAGAGDDLDYMHARHASPFTGRFLSIDPSGESFNPKAPQSWNRYTYVQDRPVVATDPTGEVLRLQGSRVNSELLEHIANKGLYGYDLAIDDQGYAVLRANNEAGPPTAEQAAFMAALALAIDSSKTITIGLVADSTDTFVGNYGAQEIDMHDVAAFGTASGFGPNAFSVLGHEVTEQKVKQGLKLSEVQDDGGADYQLAHGGTALPMQDRISGFTTITRKDYRDGRGNGIIQGLYAKGSVTISVTIYCLNNNVIKIER